MEEDVVNSITECLLLISRKEMPLLESYLANMEIKTIKSIDIANGRVLTLYVVKLTGAPPLILLGSWVRESIQSQLKGFLRCKLGLEDFEVKLDSENWAIGREVLSLDDALSQKLISPEGPLYEYMKKFEIDYLIAEGQRILGPDVGLMKALDRLSDSIKIDNVTELFAGTGAVTKVALCKGARKAVCVDLDLSVAKRTLSQFSGKVAFYEEDVFGLDRSKLTKIIIADPSFKLSPRFIETVVPKIKDFCRFLILTHGHTQHISWNRIAREKLSGSFGYIRPVSSLTVEMTICTNDERLGRVLSQVDL